MELSFQYRETLQKNIKKHNIILQDEEYDINAHMELIRGLYLSTLNQIIIHLDASAYKDVSEECLFTALSETIVHEFTHSLIKVNCNNDNLKAEERIAQLMAGQTTLEDNCED